jgi:uncharacterized membrane-anchored protein YhcB (DUF1043 family)
MDAFWQGLKIGLFVGTFLGILIASLCVISALRETEARHARQND